MKRVSSAFAFILGAFVTFSSAAQIQGFVTGYAPGDVKEKRDVKGVESEKDLHSDFAWGLGAEFLTFPVGNLMVGGGLGFISSQDDGGDMVVMPAMPLWGSVGAIAPEEWKVRPYVEARIGYPLPLTTFKTWWNSPLDFFVMGNIGAQLPYHMGVEINCTYLTMKKQFKKLIDAGYRLNSLKFGGSITVHFDLFKNASASSPMPAQNESAYSEPAAEEFSYGYTAPEEQPAAEPNVTDEQPAESTAEAASEDMPVAEPLAEDAAEPAPEEQETPAAEEPVEEPAAETAEAPAEEPAAEPAPEPEKKPAAKKKSSKKTKKSTKKSPKKSTKKTAKKKK